MKRKIIKIKRVLKERKGQALMELLVGVGVGAIILGSSVGIARVSTRSNVDVQKMKAATFLAKEMEVNLDVLADADWNSIYQLSKGASNHYHLEADASPFTVSSNSEEIVQDNVTYSRYFYTEDVYRSDSNDAIAASGGSMDPSTERVTVIVNWQGEDGEVKLIDYLARYRNFSFNQSDWSGGGDIEGTFSFPTNVYATSTSVSIGTTGALKLLGY